jgi:hypothetical protein
MFFFQVTSMFATVLGAPALDNQNDFWFTRDISVWQLGDSDDAVNRLAKARGEEWMLSAYSKSEVLQILWNNHAMFNRVLLPSPQSLEHYDSWTHPATNITLYNTSRCSNVESTFMEMPAAVANECTAIHPHAP